MRKGLTFGVDGSFGSPEKKFSIYVNKEGTRFSLSLHYNGDYSYWFVNGKEIFKFKANNGNTNFPNRFCLRSISDEFHANESRQVSLEEIVCDFSVDSNAIDKSNILDVHKYLMVENNVK